MEKIIDKDRINYILQQLENPQDRVLILLFYKNICNDYIEATNIKIADIDLENNTILIGDKTKYFDLQLKEQIEECMKATKYIFIKKSERTKGYYDFNMDSPYLIKTKPTNASIQGTKPLTYNSIKTKFRIIEEELGEDITIKKLKTSGVIETILTDKKNELISIKEVEKFLIDNDIKMNSYGVYTLLKKKVIEFRQHTLV